MQQLLIGWLLYESKHMLFAWPVVLCYNGDGWSTHMLSLHNDAGKTTRYLSQSGR